MKIYSVISIFAIASILLFAGCDKNEINYGEFEKVSADQTLIKFNVNIALAANPSYQIKINGQRVSTLIPSRYPYPGGGYNTSGDSRADYLPIKTGSNEVSFTIPKKGTNIDSVELYKTTVDVASGKAYSLHVSDTTSAISAPKSLLVEDDFTIPDSGFVRFRFVHLMPGVAPLDLYNGTTLVKSNISYLKASDFFTLPIGTPTGSVWSVRLTGSAPTSTAIATYTSANTITNKRVYTVFATGYIGKTDATRKPYVSFYLVR